MLKLIFKTDEDAKKYFPTLLQKCPLIFTDGKNTYSIEEEDFSSIKHLFGPELEKIVSVDENNNPRDNYDGFMDKECIELCDAINSIEGLQTIESCCGHGKHAMWIWFSAKNVKNLMTIGRITDRRYSIILHDWQCIVSCTDGNAGVVFWLHSGSAIGQKAYDEAKVLARNIREHLTHPEYMKWYNSIK